MQESTPRFQVLDFAIQAIEVLRPVVERVRSHDRNLADQIRRAASSVALNLAEGNHSDPGNRRARFFTAAGSNAEVRSALRVARAWGYVTREEVEQADVLLDRVAAILHRPNTARRS